MNIYSNLCLSTNQSFGDGIVTREQFSEYVIRKPIFFHQFLIYYLFIGVDGPNLEVDQKD